MSENKQILDSFRYFSIYGNYINCDDSRKTILDKYVDRLIVSEETNSNKKELILFLKNELVKDLN